MNRQGICSGWEGCSCGVQGECVFCEELLRGGLAAEWGGKWEKGTSGRGREAVGGGKRSGEGSGQGEGSGRGREAVGGGKRSGEGSGQGEGGGRGEGSGRREGRGWGREEVVQRAEGWWVTWI